MARYTKVLKSLAHNAVGARRIEAASTGTTLPSQTGQAGKFLKTDGSNLSWATSSSANNFVDSVSVNIGTGIITLGRDGLSDLTSSTLSPLTTKGDLWVFGTTNTRLPVGTNGYALVADSSTATGLNWAPNSDANYYTSSAAINSNIITGTVAGGGSNWSVDISGLTSVGTIATGVWSGTSIVDGKIASASNWNDAYNNYVASAAYSAGTLTFTQRDGGTFTATGFSQATGTVTGGGADNRIAHWTSATNVTGTSDLTYDGSKLTLGSQGKVIVKYNDEDPKESTEILHVVTSGTEASFAIEAQSASSGVKNMALLPNLNQNIKNLGQYWDTQFSPTYSDIYEWGYNGDASSANRNLYFKTVLAYPILFSTSNTERMRITSAGKVGIGTPAPAQTLDVRGTTLLSGATDAVPFEVFAYGAGTSALHVTSGSNTGLGTATPLGKLHINAGAYQQVFQRDTHHMTIVKGNSDDRLIFATGAPPSHTTRFTINNTGIDVVNDAMITGSLTTTGVATLGNNSVTNTQTAGNNSTRIATTAFVTTAVAAATGTPGGSTTQMQYNNGGSFGGTDNLYWIDGSDRLFLSGTTAELRVGNYGQSAGINFGNNADRIFTDNYTMYIQNNNSMIFNIDSNNNHIGQKYEWRHNAEGAGGAALMTLGDDGKLGIGDSTPTEKLVVYDATSSNQLGIYADSGDVAAINMYEGTTKSAELLFDGTTDDIKIINRISGGDLVLRVNNSVEGIRITGNTGAVTLGDNSVTNTQSLGNSTTRLATTEFVAAAVAAAGGGDVSKAGTPVNNQLAVWTGTNTIEGDANLTYDGTNLTLASTTLDTTSRGLSIKDNEGTETIRLATSPNDQGLLYLRGPTGGNAIYLDGGTNNSYINAGNLGIGTTSPNVKLHVNGDARIEAGHKLYFDDTGTGEYIYATGNDLRLHASDHLVLDAEDQVTVRASDFAWETDGASEKMRFKADTGRLGIGTNAPARSLEIKGNGAYMAFNSTATNNHQFTIGSDNSGFIIYDDTLSTYRFVIDEDSGNVGIGTTAPNDKLNINTGAGTFDFRDYNLTYSTSLGIRAEAGYLGLVTEAAQDVFISTNGFANKRINVKSDGKVGIGASITNPSALVDVVNTTSNWAMLVDQNNTGNLAMKIQGNYGLGISSEGQYPLDISTASSADALRMLDNGNLGLGTVTPSNLLHLKGGTLEIEKSDSSKHLTIDENSIRTTTSNDLSIFTNSNSNQLVLEQANGRVGIGTSSPSYNLDVVDNAADHNYVAVTNTTAGTSSLAGFRLQSQTANALIIGHADNRTVSRYGITLAGYTEMLSSTGNGMIIGNSHGAPLIFGTANVERMRILADGKVGIGTTTPSTTLEVNGVISATAKSFNIPHPLYKDKRLVHGSLEGPEHGIYIRGTIETEEKGCLVELPEYWSAMCEDYTVQLTPHGPYTVYIKEKLKDKVMIECLQKKFKFDYYIVGARTDETLEVVQDGE